MKVAFQTGADASDISGFTDAFNGKPGNRETLTAILNGLCRREVNSLFHYNTKDILKNGSISAEGYNIRFVHGNDQESVTYFAYEDSADLNDFDVIFVRGDDFDETTQDKTTLIDALDRPVLVNSGKATLATRDKFELHRRFGDSSIMPITVCATDDLDIQEAWEAIPGSRLVVKGRYGSSAEEVACVPRTREGITQASEYLKAWGPSVIQEFMQEIVEGDYRVHTVEGEVLGTLLRKSADGGFINNISAGGNFFPVKMLPKQVLDAVNETLRKFPEVFFQGMDVTVEGRLIETNAFPASLSNLNDLDRKHHEDRLLDKVYAQIQEQDRLKSA
ncbi:MAG: RimK family alpha-L-glutamate ligase [Candidatus Nanoarchaeia archaeon]